MRSRVVLHRIALFALVVMGATAIWLRDIEAGAFTVAILAGILLLAMRSGLFGRIVLAMRSGLFGRIVLALAFLDTAIWMLPAAISNARHGDTVVVVALPVVLSVIALLGILAAVGFGHRWTAVVGIGVALIAIGGSQLPNVGTADALDAHGLRVGAKNVAFSPASLTSDKTPVAVRITNHDLFWHTFTIDKLHVDVRVPVGATRAVDFVAKPGRYEFYCRIPGHKQAGMTGTLVVTG